MTDAEHKRVLIELAESAVAKHTNHASECAYYDLAGEAEDHHDYANTIRAAIRWLEGLSDD